MKEHMNESHIIYGSHGSVPVPDCVARVFIIVSRRSYLLANEVIEVRVLIDVALGINARLMINFCMDY